MEECGDPQIYTHAKDVQSAAKNLLAIINDILDARPSPVPSTLRLRLESTWRKSSKIFARSSSRMPQPVSSTRKVISSSSSFSPGCPVT